MVEKRIINRLHHYIKFAGFDSSSHDNIFQERFTILRDEINSGNDSALLKAELKQFIISGIQENKIAKREGLDYINTMKL